MKKMILAASMFLSFAAHAETCETATLVLKPSTETKAACDSLQLKGKATIKACDSNLNKAEVTVQAGGAYDMTGVSDAWVSNTFFSDDEDGSSITTIVTINLLSSTYHGKEIKTDRRGHRSAMDCAGTLQIQ